MPEYQRFGARGSFPATGNLVLVPGQGAGSWGRPGPTFGQRVWHVVTLRATRQAVIAGTGDTAIFYIAVGAPPGADAARFHGPEDFVDRTYQPLPTQAWYPVGNDQNRQQPGGLVVDIGQQLYAIVVGGTAGNDYVLTGYAVEFDP